MFSERPTFTASALYRHPSQSMKGFLSERWSFWLALFSCIAFLVGNMVGQHGFSAFWKSVWGADAQIVFTGTVPPLDRIPDPQLYALRTNRHYDYTDVPEAQLIKLPRYVPKAKCTDEPQHDPFVFSVAYMGRYDGGGDGCGSHPGVDILTLKGTPVFAIANGIVERVEERDWGFGNTIVIKIPNAPDPGGSGKTTTLYASYGHLGRIDVSLGDRVYKGEQIAVTGQTGFATAPHLDFTINTEDAPFKPYWPFTTAQATEAGLSFVDAVNAGLGKTNGLRYTVSPLVYTQEYAEWGVTDTVVASLDRAIPEEKSLPDRQAGQIPNPKSQVNPKSQASTGEETILPLSPKRIFELLRERVQARRATRLAQLKERDARVAALRERRANSTDSETHLTAPTFIPMPKKIGPVESISIVHDKSFHRDWEEIVLYARDADGNFVTDVRFDGTLYLDTAFGEADFAPSKITDEQFDERGRAVVRMLPRNQGRRTIVPVISGTFSAQGAPMVFDPASAQEVATTAQ